MARVKRGKIAKKRKKNILKKTKGFKWGRKSQIKKAKEALIHSLAHSYIDRKKKKRNFRRLWQVQIGAAAKKYGLSYNKFIHLLKEKKIELDRKVLSSLAKEHPEIFKKLIEKIKEK